MSRMGSRYVSALQHPEEKRQGAPLLDEEVLEEMRKSEPPIHYLVGTPKVRLTQLEAALAEKSWEAVREGVEVKLLDKEGELYVLAQSRPRLAEIPRMLPKVIRLNLEKPSQIPGMRLTSSRTKR